MTRVLVRMSVRDDAPNSRHDTGDGTTEVATPTDFTDFAMASSDDRVRFGNEAFAAGADFGERLICNRAVNTYTPM